MRTLQITSSFFLLLFVPQMMFSQSFQVPKDVEFETEEDYRSYDPYVLKGIYWLENTGVEDEIDKRQETTAFLMKWMTGAPHVSIGLQAFTVELTEKNPDLLMTFLGGWTKFALENPSSKNDVVLATRSGIESMLKVYNLNRGDGMKRDRKLERLMKFNKSELEDWIRTNLDI